MSHIHVIHWSDNHHIGEQLHRGWPEASIAQHILDGEVRGNIERIDYYDVDEHTANDVTEDVAIAVQRLILTTREHAGESVHPQLYDLIETHAGSDYVRGLRRREMTFATE